MFKVTYSNSSFLMGHAATFLMKNGLRSVIHPLNCYFESRCKLPTPFFGAQMNGKRVTIAKEF